MDSYLEKKFSKTEVFLSSVIAIGIIFSYKVCLIGNLVQKFGLSKGDAIWAVGIIASGGATIISICWPILAPYLLTLRGLIATIGSGAAAGW
ncbi:hypothetical protein [Pseudolactococcus carnosus]|uniref:hypothetical protein n=1 Tax=Pseudolactococcus carnosus TaxID=2749961 RepID=UPI001C4FE328|nr:hypothetical protein [Lactococcus carnosus]MCJ1971775.1 hypothetical protein [Lactococcus carnosus]